MMNDYETTKQDLPESFDLNDPYTQAFLLLFFLMAAKDNGEFQGNEDEGGDRECSQSPTET